HPLSQAGVTTNESVLVAVPSGVTTLMGPVVAPLGTVAVICVSESTVNWALVPLNCTSVAPVKEVPVTVTEVPTGPEGGSNPVMAGDTTKESPLVALPSGLTTVTGPVVAPSGTVAVMWVSESIVN